jgi:hypothetical protein
VEPALSALRHRLAQAQAKIRAASFRLSASTAEAQRRRIAAPPEQAGLPSASRRAAFAHQRASVVATTPTATAEIGT